MIQMLLCPVFYQRVIGKKQMPKKHNLVPTGFKCTECGGKCVYNVDLNLFVCARPIVTTGGQIQGSCGKFYLDKTKASNEKSNSENNKTKKV